MKKTLLLFFFLMCISAQSQSTNTCPEPSMIFAIEQGQTMILPNTVTNIDQGRMGCLYNTFNIRWFKFLIAQSGDLRLIITQKNYQGQLIDVDFAVWKDNGSANYCQTLASVAPTDCSYSASAIENLDITNAVAGEAYLLAVTNYSAQPGTIEFEYNSGNTAYIGNRNAYVTAFLDGNQNGIQETTEPIAPYGHFLVQQEGSQSVEDLFYSSGRIQLNTENSSTSYNVSYVIPQPYAPYFHVNPSGSQNIVPQGSPDAQNYYFAVSKISDFSDLGVKIVPLTTPRPGFTNRLRLECQNLGTITSNGTVTFTIPAGQTFTVVPDQAINVSPTSFTIAYTDLAALSTLSFETTVYTPPTTALGTLFAYSAAIVSNVEEIDNTNNAYSSALRVIGSYDPNDVTESRGKLVPVNTFNTDTDYLYYTIRFQNTGTANASFIKVEQTLSDNIIPETFEMISSSHNYVVKRSGTSAIWNFDNINLPYASANDLGSQGYIYYRVKARPGIVVGSTIDASAAIYFDYNAPVITQTYQTLFTEDTSGTTDVKANRFVLYPNPANESVNIQATENITAVSVYDISGKTLISKPVINGQNVSLSLTGLQSGTYFIKVATEKGSSIKTLIKH